MFILNYLCSDIHTMNQFSLGDLKETIFMYLLLVSHCMEVAEICCNTEEKGSIYLLKVS